MALIVQKYGGTSVGSVERIQVVAQRVRERVKTGNSLIVVVSAMGKTTDGLVKLAREITENPSHREMDMLLSTGEQVSIALVTMALQELGQPAISLTGAQVGIMTEAAHTRARILNIATERIEQHINEGKVVVVAGFQGISNSENLEITTLGRGGSDTSAVALAAALQANRCEIYTDVPGILTTDPRLVPQAQLMDEITCNEMLELASLGAKVLHPRAVEIARNYGVPLVVRSSWTNDPGTYISAPKQEDRSLVNLEIARPVDTVEFDTNQAKVSLLRVPDKPGVAARLFGEIARQDVDVDLIIQSIHEGNSNDIAFTVMTPILKKAEAVAEAIAPVLRSTQPDSQGTDENSGMGEAEVMVKQNIAKVSIVGAGMIGRPGVAAKMFATLAEAGVNVQMISTSEIKVSCVVDEEDCDKAVSALCNTFEISTSPRSQSIPTTPNSYPPVRGVALDAKQAQLAIRHVPDRPGMAKKIFGLLAENNISVDMIIQSQRCHVIDGVPKRDVAFTVCRTDAEAALNMLKDVADEYGWGEVVLDRAIAKVSVVGAGMLGQPGIAAKMFESLARNNINIQMISTSEIKISCVVAEDEGVQALQVIHEAFGLSGSEEFVVPA
ncbi:aspartate kinase [Mastigocoleus sp. MO_188.B34]|uniref:aspartate kinase n=1 Tax=Mastigocoleus sp. MO_188.B34 TaxID=3036635 RepID=UPI00261C8618|nr:aspartate kinase [Mastigocoleus sp. MO_188.B34]MDJ0695195.1 aspartate kinase [Mastigocoleus sp. MO_188.B34]